MTRRLLKVLLFFNIQMTICGQTTVDHPLFPSFLVTAEARKVVNDGKVITAELDVVEVLYGPNTLNKLSFQVSMNSSAEGGVGAVTLYPPLAKGDRGVWPVRIDQEGNLSMDRASVLSESLGDLPCRWQQERNQWEEITDLANTIRTVSNAEPAKRQEIVVALLSSESALKRRWAEYAKSKLEALIEPQKVTKQEASPQSNPNVQSLEAAPSANPPPTVQPPLLKKTFEQKPTPTTSSEEPASSTPWSIIVVLIVAATGLLWLLVKKRK
jgi:hypothetical protein